MNYYTEVHKIDFLLKEGTDAATIANISAMTPVEVQSTIHTIQMYEASHPDWNTYPEPNKVMDFLERKYAWIVVDLGLLILGLLTTFFMGGFMNLYLLVIMITGTLSPKQRISLAPIYVKSIYLDHLADKLASAAMEREK